jgi:hypothetical protein
MESQNLAHLIYTSAATPAFRPTDLQQILEVARRNNAANSITGLLLFSNGTFFQVLEGQEQQLATLFETIKGDSRHKSVTLIIHESIAGRSFADWSLGYLEMGPTDRASLDDGLDFAAQPDGLAKLPPGRAKKLLQAFTQGRWRARIAGGRQ